MYDFAVHVSPADPEHAAFLFIACESFFEFICFIFFIKAQKRRANYFHE
jgi:hypothetical protein